MSIVIAWTKILKIGQKKKLCKFEKKFSKEQFFYGFFAKKYRKNLNICKLLEDTKTTHVDSMW